MKNFPDDLYQRPREIVDQEQRFIAQQVIRLLDEAVSSKEPQVDPRAPVLSILDNAAGAPTS